MVRPIPNVPEVKLTCPADRAYHHFCLHFTLRDDICHVFPDVYICRYFSVFLQKWLSAQADLMRSPVVRRRTTKVCREKYPNFLCVLATFF